MTGSREKRRAYEQKLDAADKIHASTSTATRARRAAFNLSASGVGNMVGDDELVDAVASGRVDVDDVPQEHLPSGLAAMAPWWYQIRGVGVLDNFCRICWESPDG